MSENIKKKSRIEMEKEKFLDEKKKIEESFLKIKNSELKSQVLKFDVVNKSISKNLF